jgi:transposase
MKMTEKRAQEILQVLEETRKQIFKDRKRKYPYTEWEHKRAQVKQRLRRLPDYVKQAVAAINKEEEKMGRPPKLDLEKKVNLFLLARLLSKSNRGMEEALELFQPLFGFDVSYKYIERLYGDEEVKIALHNLFVLLLRDEGASGDLAGDGTGYSVKVESHYRTDPRKNGKKYIHFFSMIDLGTGMYVGCGVSRVSEMAAFQKAVEMLKRIDAKVRSVRLDRYYSSKKVIEQFGRKVSMYLVPKKNIARVGGVWADIFGRMVESPVGFLSQYFLRNACESGFSSDKRRFERVIRQRREDRQETALFSNAFLHNLYAIRIGPKPT